MNTKKRRYCFLVLLLLALMLFFSGCDDEDWEDWEDEEEETTEVHSSGSKSDRSKGDWTVLLYLCGTDLESESGAGSLNLEEILDADLSDNVNFVIETGGTEEWQTDDIDSDILGRYLVENNSLELVDEQELANMSDVDTFTDFMKWGVSEFPADKYMVILWDHGCGSVEGVVYDELFSDDEMLSVKDIAQGIAATNANFELVGFDACLMSTLEQAAAICPYANYMVASEETEPGAGWDYTTWLNELSENTAMDGEELGRIIVDSFYEKCVLYDEEEICTLAVTDLRKIPALVDSFSKMSAEMKGCTNDFSEIKIITGAFKAAQGFGGNNDDEGYTDMVDLGDLALNAQGVLDETAEQVIDDLLEAVIYKKNGSGRNRSEGLAVYVPLSQDEDRYEMYAQNAAISGDYLRFIEELYNFDTPSDVEIIVPSISSNKTVVTESVSQEEYEPAEKIQGRNQKIKYSMKINDDGYIQADIKEGADIIDAARCNLYWIDTEEDLYYYFGSDYNVYVNDDWTSFEDNFDNTWVYINGNLCMLNPVSISDDMIEYYVPVYVNDERTNIRLIWSMDEEEFKVLSLWDGIDENGIPSRDFRKIQDGDQIDFIFKVAESLDDEPEEVYVEGFKVKGEIEVTEEDLGDGEYAYSFTFEDIFGGTTETKAAYFYVEDNEIYASESRD